MSGPEGEGTGRPSRRGANVPALDGLRGVSAQIVCLAHAAGLVVPEAAVPAQVAGWLARVAVIVFFVVSGFAIAVGIARIRAERGGRFDPRLFAIHRAARIYPPYLASLLLVWTIAALLALRPAAPHGTAGEVGWPGMGEILRALVFAFLREDLVTRLNGPLWSLRIEVVLYVLAACACVALDGRGARRLLALAFGLALAAAAAWRLYFAVPAMILFGAGAFAAAAWLAGRRAPASADAMALALAGFVGLTAVPAVQLAWLDLGAPSPVGAATQVAIGLAVAAFVWALAVEGGLVGRMLARLRRLGGFAYTLYVVHVPLFILGQALFRAFEPDPHPASRLAVALVLLLGVEAASLGLAALVERPAWFRRRIGRVLAAPA